MTALITGSSRGIGAATAIELGQTGHTIAINYKSNREAAESVKSRILSCGGRAEIFQADISDPSDVNRLFSEIEQTLGGVDILINNAGTSHIGLIQDMTDDEVIKLTNVNLIGAMLCSKRAIKHMVRQKSGVIINISSMWGEVGASCEVVYSACKAGIIGFTKALAKELGPSGIRVNCVSPGLIDTDMNSELTKEDIASLCDDTPLLRIGTPHDVASVIAFLASDDASFVTGQIVPVNGGYI